MKQKENHNNNKTEQNKILECNVKHLDERALYANNSFSLWFSVYNQVSLLFTQSFCFLFLVLRKSWNVNVLNKQSTQAKVVAAHSKICANNWIVNNVDSGEQDKSTENYTNQSKSLTEDSNESNKELCALVSECAHVNGAASTHTHIFHIIVTHLPKWQLMRTTPANIYVRNNVEFEKTTT